MSGARVTGLFRAIAGEAKAAGSTYFAPARAAAKAISDMAHAEDKRARTVAGSNLSQATKESSAKGSRSSVSADRLRK